MATMARKVDLSEQSVKCRRLENEVMLREDVVDARDAIWVCQEMVDLWERTPGSPFCREFHVLSSREPEASLVGRVMETQRRVFPFIEYQPNLPIVSQRLDSLTRDRLLVWAAEQGHVDYIIALTSEGGFGTISARIFDEALRGAAKHGHCCCVDLLVREEWLRLFKSPEDRELIMRALGSALHETAIRGEFYLLEKIIYYDHRYFSRDVTQSGLLREIRIFGHFNCFGSVLWSAMMNGHHDFANLFLDQVFKHHLFDSGKPLSDIDQQRVERIRQGVFNGDRNVYQIYFFNDSKDWIGSCYLMMDRSVYNPWNQSLEYFIEYQAELTVDISVGRYGVLHKPAQDPDGERKIFLRALNIVAHCLDIDFPYPTDLIKALKNVLSCNWLHPDILERLCWAALDRKLYDCVPLFCIPKVLERLRLRERSELIVWAAGNNRPDCLSLLMDEDWLGKVSTEVFGQALSEAAKQGHSDCVQIFLGSKHLCSQDDGDDCFGLSVLGDVLVHVAKWGDLCSLKLLIESRRFDREGGIRIRSKKRGEYIICSHGYIGRAMWHAANRESQKVLLDYFVPVSTISKALFDLEVMANAHKMEAFAIRQGVINRDRYVYHKYFSYDPDSIEDIPLVSENLGIF